MTGKKTYLALAVSLASVAITLGIAPAAACSVVCPRSCPVLEDVRNMGGTEPFVSSSWNPFHPFDEELERIRSGYDGAFKALVERSGYSAAGLQTDMDALWAEAGKKVVRRNLLILWLAGPLTWNHQRWELYKTLVARFTERRFCPAH